MLAGIANSSRKSYLTGFCRYQAFCQSLRRNVFPASERIIVAFVTSLANSGLRLASIKIYLCGIHYIATVLSHACNLSSMGQLRLLARGIRRSQGRSLRPSRSPITPSHLRRMLYFIQNSRFSPRDKSLWRALILTAFFGLLRVSEYTSPSVSSFNPSTN